MKQEAEKKKTDENTDDVEENNEMEPEEEVSNKEKEEDEEAEKFSEPDSDENEAVSEVSWTFRKSHILLGYINISSGQVTSIFRDP